MDNSKSVRSGKRVKKRKFHGNMYIKKSVDTENNKTTFVKKDIELSAKSKKLQSKSSSRRSSLKKVSENFKGYRLVNINLLFSAIAEKTVCSICYGKIELCEKSQRGLSSTFEITCSNKRCSNISSFSTSEMVGIKNNAPEINRRAILAMRAIGHGLTGLQTFCQFMCLPTPVGQKTYDAINEKIAQCAEEVALESMNNAAQEEKVLSQLEKFTVSGDGTWKTRGHTSLIGVCSLIGAETGKVIDVEVMSSFCKGCSSYKGPKFGPSYEKWMLRHKTSCRKNHSGSAGKMEVDGMLRIFKRSEAKHGVKYLNYIGDGDSKTFTAISDALPYGNDMPVEKIECVGHVQKRLGTRLRKLKANLGRQKLKDGKTIGGKGRLTDALVLKLTTYYGNAIRKHSNSVVEMRKAVWAVWAHHRSADDEPMHMFCPQGKDSWCSYNRAVHNNTVDVFKHKNSVSKVVMDKIKPIFADLCHPKLLKKCLGGKTQNANESFNSVIWKYCPKVFGCGVTVAKIATHFATLAFNDGMQSFLSLMEKLEVKIDRRNCVEVFRKDQKKQAHC